MATSTYTITFQRPDGSIGTAGVAGPPPVSLPIGLGAALVAGVLVNKILGWLVALGTIGWDVVTLYSLLALVPQGARPLAISLPDGQTIQIGPASAAPTGTPGFPNPSGSPFGLYGGHDTSAG